MPEYRAFIVGPDGHFSGFDEMVCDDHLHAPSSGHSYGTEEFMTFLDGKVSLSSSFRAQRQPASIAHNRGETQPR
jgi:hypothetical protein